MNAAVLISGVGNRAGLVLYASLAMGYYFYARGCGEMRRRETRWQSAWLLIVLLLTALSGSVHDTLIARQLETSLLYEGILRVNKVVPRVLWFPVLSQIAGIRLKRADGVLMAGYGLVMLLTPRFSNLASLIWGVPFLWAVVRMENRGAESRKKQETFLLACFSLHLLNALVNFSGLGGEAGGSPVGMLIRAGITAVCYPALFAADLTGRFLSRCGAEEEPIPEPCPEAAIPERPLPKSAPAEPSPEEVIGGMALRCALTPRETEIVQYLYKGLSNREIAERLCVAEGTVKAHNYNIYTKLGITKRTQLILAVNRAREEGPNAAGGGPEEKGTNVRLEAC